MGGFVKKKVTLEEIARRAMIERGFIPDFPESAIRELATIKTAAAAHDSCRDMRGALWISIDNEDSKDLDQLTFAESDKIFIAVADVDALVKKNSAIDAVAAHNTTSVYTPAAVFPMLPLKLSTDLTSLNERCDRCAIVVELTIALNGRFELKDLYHALVRNQAKLSYPSVGAWLASDDKKGQIPPLSDQLLLQDHLAQKIQQYRNTQGALEFAAIEMKPVIVNGIPVALEERGKNRAHTLIANTMIAANVAVTCFLKSRKLPTLRRVVKLPKRWNRIVALAGALGEKLPASPDPKALRQFLLNQQFSAPLQFPDLSLAIIKLLGRGEYVLGLPGKPSPGHFDLAEHEYTHATAPNRRFPDLIVQRLLKNALFNQKSAYRNEELAVLAAHCTKKEDDATKVERRLMKCAAATLLEKEIGRIFPAMVTGASPKGTWVRLQAPPIEGKLTKGFKGVDVGDFLKVKLTRVDVLNGHIDFARVF